MRNIVYKCFCVALFFFLVSGCKKEDDPQPTKALAEVSTSPVESVTFNSARAGGNVLNDGNAEIISRGICYDINPNPDKYDFTVSSGNGTGSFSVDLSNLQPNTQYFIRAYATNSVGITYGNEVSFTTQIDSSTIITLPTLTTSNAFNITSTSAYSGGVITDDGGSFVVSRGICYSLSQNPTVSDSIIPSGIDTGTFSINITGLQPNTTYYVRAYASNSVGIVYGNEISFTTLVAPILNLLTLDNIRLMDPGPTNLAFLPANSKIEVTVTSNYLTQHNGGAGRNMFAQDNTAGIQIRFISSYSFPLGTKLEINISNMEISTFNGVFQINNVPLTNAVSIGTSNIAPRLTTIADINANYDLWEGQLVKLNGVTISGSGIYGGTNTITDASLDSITLYTYSGASFATNNYPIGIVSITGVLFEYNGLKEISIRDVSDIQ